MRQVGLDDRDPGLQRGQEVGAENSRSPHAIGVVVDATTSPSRWVCSGSTGSSTNSGRYGSSSGMSAARRAP